MINQTGTIRYAYANPDFKVRVNPDDLLAAAKAAVGN
jgi:peroxiredoxin